MNYCRPSRAVKLGLTKPTSVLFNCSKLCLVSKMLRQNYCCVYFTILYWITVKSTINWDKNQENKILLKQNNVVILI